MVQIREAKAYLSDISALIEKALPDQGYIEIQRDAPRKEHAWHMHSVDETVIVLDGSLRFYWSDGERLCLPGDVITLPAGTAHGSGALEKGATYLTAFHAVNI